MKKQSLRSILYFLILIEFGMPLLGKAQPYVDVLNMKYRLFPAYTPSEINGDKATGNLEEGTLLLPLKNKMGNFILIGGDYSKLNFHSFTSDNSTYSLYSASLQLGYDQKLKNPAWKRTIIFLPKLNGDFIGLSRSFQAGGVLMYTYKKNNNLKYHFGLYYNRECFGDYYIPLLGIDWKINSRINLFGDLPNNLSLEIKVLHSITLGAGVTTNISSYRIHSADGINYIREGDNVLGHDQIKLYLNYYITKNIVLFGEAGQTIHREYTAYDHDNKIISSAPFQTIDGKFVTVGVAYRFENE